MQLNTLVDILRSEIPGITERASTRTNLAQLYAEQGCHDDAVSELRGARRMIRQQEQPDEAADLEASVALATSLAASGRLEEAKQEARRILRTGDVPADVSTRLRAILVQGPRHHRGR